MKHFICARCDTQLGGQRYIVRDELPYCIPCYHQATQLVCNTCKKEIIPDKPHITQVFPLSHKIKDVRELNLRLRPKPKPRPKLRLRLKLKFRLRPKPKLKSKPKPRPKLRLRLKLKFRLRPRLRLLILSNKTDFQIKK
jgi:hypothetical protein